MSSDDRYIMSTEMPDAPLNRGAVRGKPPRNICSNYCEQISVTAGEDYKRALANVNIIFAISENITQDHAPTAQL